MILPILIQSCIQLKSKCSMTPCIMEKVDQLSNDNQQSKNTPEHIQSDTISHMIKQGYRATAEQIEMEAKINHLKHVSTKRMPRESQEPTFREITQLLQALKEQMGNKDLSLIVKELHNNCVVGKKDGESNCKKKQKIKNWEDLLQQKSVEIPPIVSRQYILRPQIPKRKSFRKVNEQRYAQKKLVAKSFVTRDYGLKHLQEEVLQSRTSVVIKRQRYTDLAYGVVTQGYRFLEQFLLNQCKRNIRPSDKFQIGALHSTLCNCRILLNPEDSLTFLKFVKVAFDLQSASITQEAAVKLYINLQKFLKGRIGNRQLDQSTQKKKWTKYKNMIKRKQFKRDEYQKFVTPEIQKQMVDQYLKCESIAKLRVYLINKYPQQQHLFNLESVNGVICKIVRITIKRVFYYKEKYKEAGLPQIVHLESSYRNKISKAGQALNARRLLLKLWKSKQSKILQKLPMVIYQINKYVRQKEQEKVNYVIAKAKANGNVIQKVQFNINVSRTKLTQGFRTSAQDEIVLKGKEKDFHHFINSEKGKKLHYYRKIQQRSEHDSGDIDKVKIQQNGVKMDPSDSDSDSSEENKQEDKGQNYQNREGSSNNSKESENKTQLLIKEWLQRLDLDFFKNMS